MKAMKAWGIIGSDGKIVNWKSLAPDGEEGLEIHRTRRLARGGRFKGERVVRVEVKILENKKARRWQEQQK